VLINRLMKVIGFGGFRWFSGERTESNDTNSYSTGLLQPLDMLRLACGACVAGGFALILYIV
jgi:hypothetical protein